MHLILGIVGFGTVVTNVVTTFGIVVGIMGNVVIIAGMVVGMVIFKHSWVVKFK